MPTPQQYIIKGFALKRLKDFRYAPGVAGTIAGNIALKNIPRDDFSVGINKLPTSKFVGAVSYWAQLKIPAGSYIVVNQDGSQSVIEYEELDFITCLITIQMNKNIIETVIQGKDGSVKEYISDGDYNINIKGVFTEAGGVYPEEDVNKLKEICQAKASIPIISAWLQQFDITDIVIKNYSFPQKEGFYNTQLFEIIAASDSPVELFIQ